MNLAGPLVGLASGALALLFVGCAGSVDWDFGTADGGGDGGGVDATTRDGAARLDASPFDSSNKPGDASSRGDGQSICNNASFCCNSNPDCNGGRCEMNTHQCVECLDGNDCSTGMCVGYNCVKPCQVDASNQCGRSSTCGVTQGFCLNCQGPDDCAGRATSVFCNQVHFDCVECLDDSNCGAGKTCSLMGECFFNPGAPSSTNHDP